MILLWIFWGALAIAFITAFIIVYGAELFLYIGLSIIITVIFVFIKIARKSKRMKKQQQITLHSTGKLTETDISDGIFLYNKYNQSSFKPSISQTKMVICPECGNKQKTGAKVCAFCNHKFTNL